MTSPGVHPMESLPTLALPADGTEMVELPASARGLLAQLALALDRGGIRYCQWKGHWSAHRWSRGYGDVDLLVDHGAVAAFRGIADQLGFKLALPDGERQIPAVEHYIGFDPQASRLLHLHVHYRLLLGEFWCRVYRIPIEQQVLEQSVAGQLFRVPSPTHTYLIFVLRMMLRQVGRPLLSADSRWLSGIQVPLASLEAASDTAELAQLLQQHLTPIDLTFFRRCVRALEGRSSRLDRLMLTWQLHLKLRPYMRHPPVSSLISALTERFLAALLPRYPADHCMRLAGGGVVVALVGETGSSKSNCARELYGWLAPKLPTMRADLGEPPKSLLTMLTGAALQLQRAVEPWLHRTPHAGDSLELFRHVCSARDRYRLYGKVRRFAMAGGIAVCERYPVTSHEDHAAPVIPGLLPKDTGGWAGRMRREEVSYYRRMLAPDALLVLKLDPSESQPEVMRQLKTAIWALL